MTDHERLAEAEARIAELEADRQRGEVLLAGKLAEALSRAERTEAALKAIVERTAEPEGYYFGAHCGFCWYPNGTHRDDCVVMIARAALAQQPPVSSKAD